MIFIDWLDSFRNGPELRRLYGENGVCRLNVQNLEVVNANLLQKVKDANDFQYQVSKDKAQLALKVQEMQAALAARTQELVKAQGDLEKVKTELAMQSFEPAFTVPEWLDNTKKAYTVYQNVEGNDVYLQYADVYDPLQFMKRKIALEPGFRALPKNAKLMKLWEWAARAIYYKTDNVDNWQFAVQSERRGKGDCEDGAIYFLTGCFLAGIRADQAFNAVGPTDFGYHSYPIVIFDEDAVLKTDGSSFYVCESTLDSIPARPMPLKGSKYHVETVQNWRPECCGQPDSRYSSLFNGIAPGAGGEQRKIENGLEKRKAINDHWKQWAEKGV